MLLLSSAGRALGCGLLWPLLSLNSAGKSLGCGLLWPLLSINSAGKSLGCGLLWAMLILSSAGNASSRGLLLLYRPTDISLDCALSQHLRFDLSFGMGMSDTITLVFRTMEETDYECGVTITTQYDDDNVELVVVIRFPNTLQENCDLNPNAFSIVKKDRCVPVCKRIYTRDWYSSSFPFTTKKKVRFRFVSNSSINTDMNAHLYEVTATSARVKPNDRPCNPINETICTIGQSSYCFTSGVVCDGINNCGVADWYDERKSDCELPVARLGFTPVLAIVAALCCAMLALIHLMLKCLPPLANSFFIFNANEDNRLCINPLFRVSITQSGDQGGQRRGSLIPASSSSSSATSAARTEERERDRVRIMSQDLDYGQYGHTTRPIIDEWEMLEEGGRKTTMKVVADSLQKKLRAVGRSATPQDTADSAKGTTSNVTSARTSDNL